jgi:beta-lactam-binding protein with PASTA domain
MKTGFFRKYDAGTLGGLLMHCLLAAALLMVVCLLYFYAYLPTTTNHGESITVPNVEGLPLDRVAAFLEEHDLRYEVSDSSYSANYPPLTVLKQVPVSGSSVKENRKIYVTVNRIKPPTVPVPDIIDKSLINADAVLAGSELKRGKIQLVRGPWLHLVKEIRIKGKKVVPGVRIPKGTVLDLVVMDGGSDDVPTPHVIGQELEDAKVLIFGSNLNIEVQLLSDTSKGDAVILRQDPMPETYIKVGDVVRVFIGVPGSDTGDPDDESNDDEGGF